MSDEIPKEGHPEGQRTPPDGPPHKTVRATYSGSRNSRLIESTRRSVRPASTHSSTPRLSNYTLENEIGRGGMGVVYRARQAVFQREIALKTTLNQSNEEDFITEALVTASLEHPNIIPVYDLTITDDRRIALAMKLIGGTSWESLLNPKTPEEAAQAEAFGGLKQHLELFLTVCNAIAFAHCKGIVHLDIKPENVLVGAFGEVLVVDWGLSVDFRDPPPLDNIAPHRNLITSVCGTPAYMSPEQASIQTDKLSPSTDIYLLGATLYEIVTGKYRHSGESALHTIMLASMNAPPDFSDERQNPRLTSIEEHDIAAELRAVCTRATMTNPEDRYPSVTSLQEAVEDFLSHRESVHITRHAQIVLDLCLEDVPNYTDNDQRASLYDRFAQSVAGFNQAKMLWHQNKRALAGEIQARIAFAEAAIKGGDIGLARAQTKNLNSEDPERNRLDKQINEIETAARRNSRLLRLMRSVVSIGVMVITAGSVIGYALIVDEKENAKRQQSIAERRLIDIQRLADDQRVDMLRAKSELLWPATPDKIPQLQAWLEEAKQLVDANPEHSSYLAALRSRGREENGHYSFDVPAIQWEHDTLSELVEELKTFDKKHVESIRKRLAHANTIQDRSIDGHQDKWDKAINSINESPLYDGLVIEPQLGLVPLAENRETGLWEFSHLQTGEIATLDENGLVKPSAEMGIVFVLLPGGSFLMGAETPPPKAKKGQRKRKNKDKPQAELGLASDGPHNYDPAARSSEGPVHKVELDPFFISKYEMTQGQWKRFTGHNPSTYIPGKEIGGRTISSLHPVEQVRWKEAFRTLQRMSLTIPTEAQWEYATRGGTNTVYWTGDKALSLIDGLNIADSYCKTNGGPGSWRYENWINDGYVTHSPVGTYLPNAFGLHDVVGNVWEWCMDRYGSYSLDVKAGTGERLADESSPRVFRGGGFRASIIHARSADRYSLYGKDYRAYDVGLRAARKLD